MQYQKLEFLRMIIMNYFDLDKKDFFFKSRLAYIVYPRKIFFYLACFYYDYEHHEVSKYFKCNVSSVIAGKNRVTRLLASGDDDLINDLKQIKKLLNNNVK